MRVQTLLVTLGLSCVHACAQIVSSADQATLLQLHNAARANVCQAPLTWDAGIAAKAQAWASNCEYKHNLNSQGEQVYGYGENIAAGDPTSYETVTVASNSWINEDQWFTCTTNTCNPPSSEDSCGHYTQVVWSSSTTIGCGYAACPSSSSPFGDGNEWAFWVCDYDPPGNYVGESPVPASDCGGCPTGSTVPTAAPTTASTSTTAPGSSTTTPGSSTGPTAGSTAGDINNPSATPQGRATQNVGGIVAGVIIAVVVVALLVLAVIFRRQLLEKYHSMRYGGVTMSNSSKSLSATALTSTPSSSSPQMKPAPSLPQPYRSAAPPVQTRNPMLPPVPPRR